MAIWAVIAAVLLLSRLGKIWGLAQGSWVGVLAIYLALFFAGVVLVPIFGLPDKIENKWLKFGVQMLLCLIIAILVGLGIAFYAT